MSTLTIISPSITQTFLPLIAWDNINPDSCVRVEADVKGSTGATLFLNKDRIHRWHENSNYPLDIIGSRKSLCACVTHL